MSLKPVLNWFITSFPVTFISPVPRLSYSFFLERAGIALRASCILGECSASELHPPHTLRSVQKWRKVKNVQNLPCSEMGKIFPELHLRAIILLNWQILREYIFYIQLWTYHRIKSFYIQIKSEYKNEVQIKHKFLNFLNISCHYL